MKKPYQVTQEQFDILRQRYESVTDADIDPRIQELVRLIGSRHTLVPVWSCSGHSQVEVLEGELDRAKRDLPVSRTIPKPNSTTEGYVIFALAPGDETDFLMLAGLVSQVHNKIFKTYRPTLSLMTLVWLWEVKEDGGLKHIPLDTEDKDGYERYPLWKLQYRVPRNDDMQAHASGFVDVCREYLNGSFKEQENV